MSISPVCMVLALLVADEPAVSQAASPRADVTPLFTSGENGYGRYRIPSLYVTPKETLLALCEGRVRAGGAAGDIDLVLRRSTDGGRTWSPLTVVVDDGPNTIQAPCPVADRSTGVIWLPFSRNLGDDDEAAIVAGTSRGRAQVWLTHSRDDGLTWAEPIDISAQATRPDWTWYNVGPGFGLQLASGRLLVPAYHAVAGEQVYRVHMLYSDDHGRTWQLGDDLRDHTTEAQVARRADGELVVNARNVYPPDRSVLRNRVVARSVDDGRTWTDVTTDSALTESSCQASLLNYTAAAERSRWLFTNPPGPGRRGLTLRLSYDEGRTWPLAKLIEPGTSEYSCLARLPDGSIGLMYERDVTPPGEYRVDIVFTRLTLDELERP
jgi:sialidase-1